MGARLPGPAATPAAPKPATGAGQTAKETAAVITATPEAPPVAAPAGAPPPPAEPAPAPEGEPKEGVKPEDDPRFGPRFAALSKRERAIVDRETKVKASEAEVAEYQKAKADAKLNPIQLLKAHGWDYDTVTQFVLNDNQLTDAQKVKILEAEKAEGTTKAQQEAERAARAQAAEAETNHRKALKEHVDSKPDDYKLIRKQDNYDLVYEVQASHWQKTFNPETKEGQILDFDTAAKMVEDHLRKQAEASWEALGRTPVNEPGAPATSAAPPQASSPTLTNRMHSTATPAPAPAGKYLSDEESKREAAKLLRFT